MRMQKILSHKSLIILLFGSCFLLTSCDMARNTTVNEESGIQSALNSMSSFVSRIVATVRSFLAGKKSIESEYTFSIESIFDKSESRVVYSIVIIGSGPGGLTAALYAAREKLRPLIFKGGEPGGLLMQTTDVTNWPGDQVVIGRDLIDRMTNQVNKAGVDWSDDSVESIDVSQWPYAIHTVDGKTVYALTIVIATGARSLHLGVPGEDKYWGVGVTTCAICDASLPANLGKTAVVVGGGDSAVEEAMQSAAHQKEVTLLVRKDHLRAAKGQQKQLEAFSNIKVIYNVEVKEVLGESVTHEGYTGLHMTGVRLYNNITKEESIFPAQMLFLAIGHVPNSDFVKNILKIEDGGYLVIDKETQETSVKGIFAAGEVADHRYRQAITSSGYGAMAGLSAIAFLQRIGFNPHIAQRLEIMTKEALATNPLY